MTDQIILAPLVPVLVLWILGGIAAGLVIFAAVFRLSGWWLRALAAVALLAAAANPSLQQEDRRALSDIVIALIDETASQQLSDRAAQSAAALEGLRAEIAARPDTELREIRLLDGAGDAGTLAMQALTEALAEEPRARIAGVVLISDGQIHDMDRMPAVPAPVHLLQTGHAADWDRRLIVRNAPAFAILGEEFHLTLRIEDQGRVPPGLGGTATLSLSLDGGEPQSYRVPVGQDIDLPVVLPHGGMNVIQFTLETSPGELTDRNNAAVLQINGVRDRLRVLLVSGEPHAGERTWRNLLKSDSSVDLVHFTILRPPEKQDGVPVTELSLIAFPTRELFLEKIDEFDLIIFDRYKRRGILPVIYLDNIRQYVMDGGAVLVAAGPDFAGAASIYRSPLAEIIPAEPTARVYEQGYLPQLTDLGRRHPVTEGLDAWGAEAAQPGTAGPHWGRWFRMIDLAPKSGETVMSGPEDKPLLVLDRMGEGRVALLASDQAWLWDRGFEGGGPQLELLRRLAHWMMKEPELEEEALWAEAEGQSMTVIRRTLADTAAEMTVTGPDGRNWQLTPQEVSPGRFEAELEAPGIGLYRITDGTMDAVIALGPSAPREFEQTIATGEAVAPLVGAMRGGVMPLEEGMPDLRAVGPGRPAAGRGWIGITPREAYVTADLRIAPLLPSWAFLALAAALITGAWLLEGRRRRPAA
ncbi:hypothetical protein [Mangrovicoccus algicola]|uniref:Glutamine amidotransferase domain-containing protein n=1 Tax=Mangrovicoccus algicola TaxID=2771008 RepID=A0A8J6Z3Q6_9RHOB|nr:hypothetical protein [Mangrovicoccus algicola]MBE3636924.1 hypothetical protein [Mangrovicoccus algicola]